LYDYAYSHVVTETPKQTPGKWSYKQQGDIVIARNPRPLAKQVALPAEIQQSIEDSRPWVREGVISELNRLLNGRNLALAQAAHEALKRLAEDDSRKVAAAAAQSLNAYEAGPHAEVERVEQAPPGQERLEAEHLAAEKAKQVAEAKYLNAQQAEEERARQEADRKVKEEAERKTAEAAQRAREAEQMRQTAAKQAQHPPAEALRSGMVTTPPADKSKKMKRVYVVVAIIIIAMILMGILIASTAQPGATPTPPPAIGFADPTRPPAAPTLTPTPNIPAAVTQGGYVVVAQGINFRQDAGATAQDYLQPATTVTSIRSPIPTQSPEPTPTPSVGRTQTRN
jgi:hypothetical protein